MRRRPWLVAFIVCGAVLFVLAVRKDVYQVTSPSSLSWHILLRKSYSIGAFAGMGFLFVRAFAVRRAVISAALAIAAYSAAIEIGQRLAGSQEGIRWNLIDVACGLVGGAIGAAVALGHERLLAIQKARSLKQQHTNSGRSSY